MDRLNIISDLYHSGYINTRREILTCGNKKTRHWGHSKIKISAHSTGANSYVYQWGWKRHEDCPYDIQNIFNSKFLNSWKVTLLFLVCMTESVQLLRPGCWELKKKTSKVTVSFSIQYWPRRHPNFVPEFPFIVINQVTYPGMAFSFFHPLDSIKIVKSWSTAWSICRLIWCTKMTSVLNVIGLTASGSWTMR